ncbi:spinster family MFS transporter [Sphingobium sp. B12D2B]|uniref:spinster family MFS transporter n=1 Tax=Sphingobium sp. B12D2B TaxID=2940577 RepID=UPI0022259E47|nr:MFS transporter [Sphingobium sp. B12D2B]MCW2350464.1 putative MFS family arabinose efflux permease [Sphingobium sp. B12D2B]
MATTTQHDTAEPVADETHPLLRPGYKKWAVFVLLLVSIFNFADRAILAVLAQPIKEDLGLTDTDLGILQGLGFAIMYSVLGVPLGMLAERVNRTRLIAICVAAWSAMTAVCGLATGFTTLLLGRIGVGIGEAGVQPPTSSLLSDHYKANRRASVLAVISLGSPFGFLLGQSLGGWVATQWDWRTAFFVMAAPGIMVSLLVWFTLREPPRGLADGRITRAPVPSLGTVLRFLLAKKTYIHLLAGVTIAGFTLNAIANFVLPFYLRSFEINLATLGVIFGIVTFTSNGIGMLLGGFGFDWLSRRDMRWVLWGPALCMSLCVPIYFGAFMSRELYVSLACIFFGNMALITFMAPTMGTMQNLAGPQMRAMTAAITALVGGLLGAGLGPTVTGVLSDFYARRAYGAADFATSCPGGRGPDGIGTALDAACLTASSTGLRYALVTVLVLFFWAALHYVLAARDLRKDVYKPEDEGGVA